MRFGPLKTAALTAAVFSFSAPLMAQVDVVDVRADTPAQSKETSTPAIGSTNQNAQLFYQLQTLQQEVLELRGLVEEQSYQLKRLKQQRLDDYLELDRRVSALSSGSVQASASATEAKVNASQANSNASQASGNEEAELYRAAFGQLKKRKIDEAITGFTDQIKQYPNGEYSANAHYWLGEIYLLQDKLPKAREWFTKLLESFPGNRKESDAKFKLSKVYFLQGDKNKAKTLLTEVVKEKGSAASLAEKFLTENF